MKTPSNLHHLVLHLEIIAISLILLPVALFSQDNEWINYTSNSSFNISAIADDGTYLWVGGNGEGLIKLHKTSGEIIYYNSTNSGLPTNYIRSLAVDRKNNLWIGTAQGLVKFDEENWTVFDTTNSDLPGNYIFCIISDTQNNKWIGTDAGLVMFDGENWAVYTTENSNLISNLISTIAIDKYGNKWIGTQLGGLSVYREGGVILTSVDTKYRERLPSEFLLYQNYPNPFNPETTIRFDLPKSTHVKLEIYNLLGRSVITLTDRRYVQGTYQLLWNGKDNLNHAVSNGVYVYVLKTDTETISRKMILLR